MDEHKRFCTLQLIVRFVNGPKSELYAGQPWPEICFRGQGKVIKPIEKESWHPNVWTRTRAARARGARARGTSA